MCDFVSLWLRNSGKSRLFIMHQQMGKFSHCLPSSQCFQCSHCSERSASRAHLSEQFEARVRFQVYSGHCK
ncbi:hypothetical protein FIBSPDRAFT_362585 [Athelia psychrophila]|uniref:Uncharacterized protein n=1 Tax=Athelia psychrophila TaxID=1759441 RepID=A0A166PDM5_9AGAM|nr:hypothetical protein FIBSPDRAFT_362585 [Fibularhizoctonia sp. CBS 109695]